jgi:hypothetical protein
VVIAAWRAKLRQRLRRFNIEMRDDWRINALRRNAMEKS